MAGSSFGNIFRITTWGESHGKALGVVIDGVPAGVTLDEADIQPFMDRRAPGRNALSTPRKESDEVEILSGTFEGKTTGCPISIMVRNTSQHSADYSAIKDIYRPGHADYTYDTKYGFRDYRGGGRSSGRETVARVAAGAVASRILGELGIDVCSYTYSIGPVTIDKTNFDRSLISSLPSCMPDPDADKKAVEYIEQLRKEYDSAGGVIETIISGMPTGIGDPVFEKLSANLAKAIMSIGACKAIEFGDGFKVAEATGSENNDAFIPNESSSDNRNDTNTATDGKTIPLCKKETNHSGGILGGMSDGSDIVIRNYMKPTPSIYKSQKTVDTSGNPTDINIAGRHDPVIVPRAVVVVESMCAITILDALLMNMGSRIDYLKSIYR